MMASKITAPMIPQMKLHKPFVGVCPRAVASQPPRSDPTIPTMISIRMPPPTAPGTSARAMSPMMRPMMMSHKSHIVLPFPSRDGAASRRRADDQNQDERADDGADDAPGVEIVERRRMPEQFVDERADAAPDDAG